MRHARVSSPLPPHAVICGSPERSVWRSPPAPPCARRPRHAAGQSAASTERLAAAGTRSGRLAEPIAHALGDVRKLEVERDLRVEQARQAEDSGDRRAPTKSMTVRPQARGAGGRSASSSCPSCESSSSISTSGAARRAGAAAQRRRPSRVRAGQPRGRGAGVPPPAHHQRPRAHAGRPAGEREALTVKRASSRAEEARAAGARRRADACRRGTSRSARRHRLAPRSHRAVPGRTAAGATSGWAATCPRAPAAGRWSRCRFPSPVPRRARWPVPGRLAGRFGQRRGHGGQRAQRHRDGRAITLPSAPSTPGRWTTPRRSPASGTWSSSTTAPIPTPSTAIWRGARQTGDTVRRRRRSGPGRAGARRGQPRCTSRSASTAVRSIPYNG